jgi:hypothetical protein
MPPFSEIVNVLLAYRLLASFTFHVPFHGLPEGQAEEAELSTRKAQTTTRNIADLDYLGYMFYTAKW